MNQELELLSPDLIGGSTFLLLDSRLRGNDKWGRE